MTRPHLLSLAAVAMLFSSQPRLKERKLDDIATIGVPSAMDGPLNKAARTEVMGRVSWSFEDTYLWASMGSITRFKQKMTVAVMDPGATPAEYETWPYNANVSYEKSAQTRKVPMGSGTLTVWEGTYALGAERTAAYTLFYTDRTHRLQIVWHAVTKELDLSSALAALPRIVTSYKLLRDPKTTFAEQRDAPRKEAAARVSKVSTAQAMLAREGHPSLVPGKPVMHQGAYLEWMADPEPRYQLLVPLGRIRAAPAGDFVNRPRPLRGTRKTFAGTVGWREVDDDAWVFNNSDNAYLPMSGTEAALAAKQQDKGFVYFYYIATVRVEQEDDDTRLTSLAWFFRDLPEVQRRWREGQLVGPGKPEGE